MNIFKNNLDVKIKIVKYLDKSGELQKLENVALSFKRCALESKIPVHHLTPLRFTVYLDFILLAEIAGEFAEVLLQEPLVAKEFLKSLIHSCCTALLDWEIPFIHLIIKVTSVPQSTINGATHQIGLMSHYGVLYELSPVEKYIQERLFECQKVNCGGKMNVVRWRGKCEECGKERVEIPRSRLSGERRYGLLLDPEFVCPSQHTRRIQGVSIQFREDLCGGLEIGTRYSVIYVGEADSYVAWGLQPILPHSLVRALSSAPLLPLPPSVNQLITKVREESYGSPWALVTSLASLLAADMYPLSSFLHLKTGLLLSLASICSKSPVPVLALGDCGVLMNQVWAYSPRGLRFSAGPSSLLLASYGVYLHGDQPALSHVTTAVESELVTVDMYSRTKGGKSSATYSLRAAIWLYWQCDKYSSQDMHRLKTLIEIFGIPFLEEIGFNDEELSRFLLNKETSKSSKPTALISFSDFREFIDVISGHQVEMSPRASLLIKNYFVASRKERPECLPLKAIKVLTGLSESHARVSFKSTVTYEDALAAIFLYEESIGSLYGHSLFREQPQRTVTAQEPIEIAKQVDATLGRFSVWLNDYIKTNSTTNETSFNFM